MEVRQRLDAQLSENDVVNKVRLRLSCRTHFFLRELFIRLIQEFTKLKPHNTVYKMIGPVLVAQDQAEAKVNVGKRLEYIKGDMYENLHPFLGG